MNDRLARLWLDGSSLLPIFSYSLLPWLQILLFSFSKMTNLSFSFISFAFCVDLYNLATLASLKILTTLTALAATLEALLLATKLETLKDEDCPNIPSMMKSTSKRIVIVEIRSRKKKKDKKYPSVFMFSPISLRNTAQKTQFTTPIAKSCFFEKAMVLTS